jgi:hypothetical protein
MAASSGFWGGSTATPSAPAAPAIPAAPRPSAGGFWGSPSAPASPGAPAAPAPDKVITISPKLGGGAFNAPGGDIFKLDNTGHTTYAGVAEKPGFERDDIVPVSLGGSNTTPQNLRYEQLLPANQRKPGELTPSDVYLESVLKDYKAGNVPLNAARIKVLMYKMGEEGLAPTAAEQTTAGQIAPTLKEGATDFASDEKKALLAPGQSKTLDPETWLQSGWDNLSSTIQDSGNRIADAVSTLQDQHASALQKGVAVGEAGMGVLNGLFTIISTPLATVERIPVVGNLVDGINNVFSALSVGGKDIAQTALDGLPLSDATKQTLKPLVGEIGGLTAQLVAGKVGADVLPSIADKTQTFMDTVSKGMKDTSPIKDPGVQATLQQFDQMAKAPASPKPLPSQTPRELHDNLSAHFNSQEQEIAPLKKQAETAQKNIDSAKNGSQAKKDAKISLSQAKQALQDTQARHATDTAKLLASMHGELTQHVQSVAPKISPENAANVAHQVLEHATNPALAAQHAATPFKDIAANIIEKNAKIAEPFAQSLSTPNLKENIGGMKANQMPDVLRSDIQAAVAQHGDQGTQAMLKSAFGVDDRKAAALTEEAHNAKPEPYTPPEHLPTIKMGPKAKSSIPTIDADTGKLISPRPAKGEMRIEPINEEAAPKETVAEKPTVPAPKTEAPKPAEKQPTEAAPKGLQTKQGESRIGKSIEQKAVEAKLTTGFSKTAGYDPITIKDQAEKATDLVNSNIEDAQAIVRGEKPLPQGLKGTALLTAMEEHLKANPDPQLAYELANSPLVSKTSEAAQEMRLAAEREPDSLTAQAAAIKAAREQSIEKTTGKPIKDVKNTTIKDIKDSIAKSASKRPTWDAFIKDLTCSVE